jgi:hypothetical protein
MPLKFLAAVAALAAALAAGEARAQMPGITPLGPAYGCIANNTCGQKGATTTAGARDYWQNWVCTGCHVGGPQVAVQQSPQERALIAVPTRFWVLHAEAEREAETRMKARQYRLLPAGRLTAEFRRLMEERPPRRR